MQLRERIIPNSEMADVNSNFNSAVEASLLELERLGMSRVLRNEKVKAISSLVIRTRFARSTKTYTTFTSCQNAACSNTFFFWRVDHALSNVILAACFPLRDHDTLIDFLWFLNFWSPWFALSLLAEVSRRERPLLAGKFSLWCNSVFFDLFWGAKLSLVAK